MNFLDPDLQKRYRAGVGYLEMAGITGSGDPEPPVRYLSTSQTTSSLSFGRCNAAKYDFNHSRRGYPFNSRPVPLFSEL